jgi:hypothetical protein
MSIPSPKERFAQELWWMLQQLEYLRISSRVGDELLFIIPWTPSARPSVFVQLTAIEKLEEKEVVKILKRIRIGNGLNLILEILQPKFDELFKRSSEEYVIGSVVVSKLDTQTTERLSGTNYLHNITFLNKNSGNKFCFFRNGEWNNPRRSSGKRWDALYTIAEKGGFLVENKAESKEIQNYFNTKPACPLYSDKQFQKTKILKQEGSMLKACIELAIITENQLEIWKAK